MTTIGTWVQLIHDIEAVLASNLDDGLKCRSISVLIRDARADDVIEAATGDGRR